MHARRLAPLRGLLAGLLALVVFASVAVAMTAGWSGPDTRSLTQALSTQTAVVAGDGQGRGSGRRNGDGEASAARGADISQDGEGHRR